ncbi:MAG: PAS domain S-box protein [Methanomicrobiaceae archaeon]|nr:PAS domain S-box protein [Methanomicrobiaceae archaeon]
MKPGRSTPKDHKIVDQGEKSLRKMAENSMAAKKGHIPIPDTTEDMQRLIHELQVHQIELEIQNEELIQARAEIEEGLQKYTGLYDFAPVGYFTLDNSGTILNINLTGAALLGRERSLLIGRKFHGFISAAFLTAFDECLYRIFHQTDKTPHSLDISIRGEPLTFVHLTGHVTGPDNECLMTITDISEFKTAEEKLKESENRYRSLFEKANEGIIFADPETMKIVHVNPAICRMLGYSKEELTVMNIADIHPKETLDEILMEFKKLAANDGGFLKAIRCLRKNSTTLITDITCSMVSMHEREYLSGFFTDVTERIKAEDALKESEEKFRNLVENVSDVIFTMDMEGKIVYISPVVEELYGFTTDEVTGRQFSQFIHPGDLQRTIEGFKRRLKGEYGENLFRIIARDGTERYVRTTQTPIIHEGRVTGFNYIMTDFTRRKKAQEALSMANKKLNMLSSITRHDILNMIMVIRGYLEMSDNTDDKNTLHEYFLKEKEAVDAIQHQIEFTRYYQDIGMNEPKWQNVGETVDLVAGTLDLEGIQLENSLKKLEIFTDPLIEKVFYNLMENSIRHGGNVSIISLSYVETDKGLIIFYRDNGLGINGNYREKLFQKGFGKHTGLGLFLSREVLSITDIGISENGKEGEGVNFEITVPKGGYRFIT